MKTSTYLSAYVKCESQKNGSTRLRPKGLVSIAVNTDSWAREWQRLDRIAYKCLDKVRTRLVATDALAEKAEKLLEHIKMGWSHGEECIALDVALRKYREVVNSLPNQQEEIELREEDTLQINSTIWNHPCWCGRTVHFEIQTPREKKYLCAGCEYHLGKRAKAQGIPCEFGVQYQEGD